MGMDPTMDTPEPPHQDLGQQEDHGLHLAVGNATDPMGVQLLGTHVEVRREIAGPKPRQETLI